MPTEQEFFDAIRAKPDDDAPRLIYADWLDEQGDCDRAAFIRAQCALALMSGDDERRPGLMAREQVLLAGQKDDWRRRLRGYGVTEVVLRRGLPEQVAISADAFVQHGGELLQQAPIRGGMILNCRDITALATSPHLSRLTHLSLAFNHIGDAGARALAASPHLSRLTSLDLEDNRIGDTGARALAASPQLRNLTNLTLAACAIGTAGAHVLTTSPHLSRLTHLSLAFNHIDDTAARVLAASPHLSRLTHLSLAFNHIGDTGARALAASPNIGNLASLDLAQNTISAAGAAALAASPHLSRLTSLDLEDNRIGTAGARALANPNNTLPALTKLMIAGNRIESAVLQEIERSLQTRRRRNGEGQGSDRER